MPMQWKTPEAFQRLLAAMVAAQDMKVHAAARSFILCCALFHLISKGLPHRALFYSFHILVFVLYPTLTMCFHLVLITSSHSLSATEGFTSTIFDALSFHTQQTRSPIQLAHITFP